jgi:hypothetical protein
VFEMIRKLITLETFIVAFFIAMSLVNGGENMRSLGETTGLDFFYTLADEADLIRLKVASVMTGEEDGFVQRANISNRTGRILREYRKEL